MRRTVPKAEAPRESRWRIEDRRILAGNAYQVHWWQTYTGDRQAAEVDFWATLHKAAPGYYWPDGGHRLVLVEDGAR